MSPTLTALVLAIHARVPVLLWGAPGTGKSSVIRQLGERLGLPVETVIASIREPSDFAGLPVVTDGRVRFAPPDWAVRLARHGTGLLFLDEISTAPPAVQAALLRVVLERTVGDLELPPGVAIVAAANPAAQAAGGWDLSAPLANRFLHLDWHVNGLAWADGFVSSWAKLEVPELPADWTAGLPAARDEIAGYIRQRPDALLSVAETAEAASRAWPSPRTWEMAARLLAAARAAEAPAEVLETLLAGTVGNAAARDYLTLLRRGAAWDLDRAFQRPDDARIPESPDALDGFLRAVIARFAASADEKAWQRSWQLLARAADAAGVDAVVPHAIALHEAGSDAFLVPAEARPLLEALRVS
ncbi:AAA family ATPase [Tepidiforma sp.]|uniref:AAA family ATPase n=1 Tax=Tepidiforma sp. TaxID=2682230 RepID=UPI0021DBE458|nr:AAA family ATPase [Tepidiforma sp.]MCX7618904.1 AAA family ATPase [Tepidiforma sp.]GIW19394.1 MAG: ATPase AAA [Tepidiforma sp.]